MQHVECLPGLRAATRRSSLLAGPLFGGACPPIVSSLSASARYEFATTQLLRVTERAVRKALTGAAPALIVPDPGSATLLGRHLRAGQTITEISADLGANQVEISNCTDTS